MPTPALTFARRRAYNEYLYERSGRVTMHTIRSGAAPKNKEPYVPKP